MLDTNVVPLHKRICAYCKGSVENHRSRTPQESVPVGDWMFHQKCLDSLVEDINSVGSSRRSH